MRKSTFALALSFLVAIAWFGMRVNQPRAAEDAKPAVQKWEYRLGQLNATNRSLATDDLNKLGNDGWELSSATQLNGLDTILIMQRPKQ